MSMPPEKVLLVDDEPRLLAGLRRRLGMVFRIETAENGTEALALLARDPEVAVIVADMQMPGMNGIELLKAVRQKMPHIKRMMLTGNSDEETAIAAVNEGQVMRFLRKPCEAATLKDAIAHAIAEYRFAAAATAADVPEEKDTQTAMTARDSFLSMINHELRTPLNHIIGMSHVLEAESSDPGKPLTHDYLTEIRNAGQDLLTLVNRILEFSRLSSETDHQFTEAYNLIDILQPEIERAREVAARNGITISMESLRRQVILQGNPGEVRLALQELLSNAVRFNTKGGHVSVTVKCLEKSVQIRFADTGRGIPADALARVMEPFSQARSGYDRPHDGLGLGLALVQSIAASNNGAFKIQSTPDLGTNAILAFSRPNISALQEQASA